MSQRHSVVFLFDVDNTLLDNDRIIADLSAHLESRIGPEPRKRYFDIFEQLRGELGYADYLGALQRYRVENPGDVRLMEVSAFLIDYPFANRLYPGSIDAVNHCKQWGPSVVVSDGDVVFQPRKVRRSAIADVFDWHVLIYIHKEQMLDDIAKRYPADHYVFIDDKVRLLTAFKQRWGGRITTIFPRQGHYALDEKLVAQYPAPDITIERIGRLVDFDLRAMLNAADKSGSQK